MCVLSRKSTFISAFLFVSWMFLSWANFHFLYWYFGGSFLVCVIFPLLAVMKSQRVRHCCWWDFGFFVFTFWSSSWKIQTDRRVSFKCIISYYKFYICGVVSLKNLSPSIVFITSSKSFCYFWTDIWGAAGCLCSLCQTSEGPCTSWLEAGHMLFYGCVTALLSSSIWGDDALSACTVGRETPFIGKSTLSCRWLLNAHRCISLFRVMPMSHSHGTFWFPLLSLSVSPLFSAWCSFDWTVSLTVWPYFDPP